MKPKIKTRLANLMARLAGSNDYDPNVKPITPLEFYFEQFITSPLPTISIPISFMQPSTGYHDFDIPNTAFERYFHTGLIKYRFDHYDGPTEIRTSPCHILFGPHNERTLFVTYIELLNPIAPVDGFVTYYFEIIENQDGTYKIDGVFNEV